MKRIILVSLLAFLVLTGYAQVTATRSDTLRKDALNVFMEANDFIRKEIPFVNYVRDIKDAGVYIISTSQRTGSGGIEYSYFLVGQNKYSGMADTLTFSSTPGETQDEIRIKMVQTLKMGLMRYVATTPLSRYMKITFTEPLSETVSSDKWNSWVFRSSVSGYLIGEKTNTQSSINGNISASRVTKDWKINFSGRYNLSIDEFEYGLETVRREYRNKSFNSLIVRSISDHWSYGGSIYLGSSLYSNYDLNLTAMPGIEYDLFPYSESTRKQLRLLYSFGYNYADYMNTTQYFKLKEGHLQHSFSAAYEVVQKWGEIDVNLEYSNYLHDWSKNNLSLSGSLSLRVAKGLMLSLSGSASMIHDQLNIRKGDATREEAIMQVKQQATTYSYYTSFGLTYTFGSIYNNVVNPRFGNQ
jgi:hypothetical protein